jgi:hypothetical protein
MILSVLNQRGALGRRPWQSMSPLLSRARGGRVLGGPVAMDTVGEFARPAAVPVQEPQGFILDLGRAGPPGWQMG